MEVTTEVDKTAKDSEFNESTREEELNRLRAKLDAAEQERLSGKPGYTLEEVFDGIEKMLSESEKAETEDK
jgi:hypothetical protein